VSESDPARAERAALRKSWPIRVFRLGEEPPDQVITTTTTAAERLAMMWPLALDAWVSMGRPLPDYPRHQAPVRVLRRSSRHAREGSDAGTQRRLP
jgi:hypothetical protein